MKETVYVFEVAGHLFEVQLPQSYRINELLPSFIPFYVTRTEADIDLSPILEVKILAHEIDMDSSYSLLSEFYGELGNKCCLYETDTHYVVEVQYTLGGVCHRMLVTKDFKLSEVFIDMSDFRSSHALSFFIMFAFAQRGVMFGTFLLHASVVIKDGKGYAFLGQSGTGKSTHSALWLKHISGSSLLNDDNPAVRICMQTNTVWISGTPWSGKTPCYKRETVRLASLVRLSQASSNRFEWLDEYGAFLSILPGCSSMRWDYRLYTALCNILEELVKEVPCGALQCLPDSSAAELCYKQIKKKIEDEIKNK